MTSGLKTSQSSSSLWTSKTREIMAMEFLLGIPLEAEADIVRQGLEGDYKHRSSKRVLLDFDEDPDLRCLVDDNPTLVVEDPSLFSPHSSDGRYSVQPNRWWEKIVSKDSSFIQAESQRAKLRALTLMEMEVLEAPSQRTAIHNPYSDEANAIEPLDLALPYRSHVHYSKDDGEINYRRNIKASLPSSMDPSHPLTSGSMYLPAPSRRLEGRMDVTTVSIPREAGAQTEQKTRHVVMARQAMVREWEQRVLHGLLLNTQNDTLTSTIDSLSISNNIIHPNEEEKSVECNHGKEKGNLLDGRIFFSFQRSYPIQVFSVIKYEPEREEALRRRKKLEERGGGGMEYILPVRDWRGISYRALLLRRKEKKNKSFNRYLRESFKANKKMHRSQLALPDDEMFLGDNCEPTMDEDEDSITSSISSSSSSDESTAYVPGFLDDPEMVQGKHRHVMIGDSVTGCIVSSTILFVPPIDLKAELNKQFRDRFDGWEPPKSQRKYIGAKIIDNVYTLIDPTETSPELVGSDQGDSHARRRKMSIVDVTLRIPPSLTLSKIRSVKQRALIACVREMQMEVSTVALACVYFERLCLDCRVDKSNRRISFAACLLLAAKINESNVAIVHDQTQESTDKGMIQSWIRPTQKQHTTFLSLFDFFTREWSIPLKNLFAAEWGVFSALQFCLNASPSQVAFHFKRLMKALEWSPMNYLSREMYDQWQACLLEEKIRKEERKQRHEYRRKQKEIKLLNLQRELSTSNRRKISDSPSFTGHRDEVDARNIPTSCILSPDMTEIKHLNRLGVKPTNSTSELMMNIQMFIPRSQSQPLFSSSIEKNNSIVNLDPNDNSD